MNVLVCVKDINDLISVVNYYKNEKTEIVKSINELNERVKYDYYDLIIISDVSDIGKIEDSFYYTFVKYIDGSFEYLNQNEKLIKEKIVEQLKILKFNLNYCGTVYLIDIIYYIYYNKRLLHDLKNGVFNFLQKKYKKNYNNLKESIFYATEEAFVECDNKIYNTYFNRIIIEKPRIKELVKCIINKIR